MEDTFTSTVDGAAAFARGMAKEEYDYTPTKAELDRDEHWDDEDRDEEESECNCSDPGCPCNGVKRGGV